MAKKEKIINFAKNRKDRIMDIEGRIIIDLGLQSGTSKAGNPWKKREMVLETFGPYPRKVKFHIFGDRVDTIQVEQGKDYVLSFDLESREFNGRWYTDVNVYRAMPYVNPQPSPEPGGYPGYTPQSGQYTAPMGGGAPMGGMPINPSVSPFGDSSDNSMGGSDEDLPF